MADIHQEIHRTWLWNVTHTDVDVDCVAPLCRRREAQLCYMHVETNSEFGYKDETTD
jgi:hypothetical protein